MPSTTRLLNGTAGLLMSLMASSGIASAEPDPSAIVNSTCSYPQVIAALRAQSPAVADQVSSDPIANMWLQQLVAAPPDQRRQMIDQAQNWPAVQQDMPLIFQVANTCNNY
jgi:hemophore-related protein